MTDAQPSRGSRLTRSGVARIKSNATTDAPSSPIHKNQSARLLEIGGGQQTHDDGKTRSSRRTRQGPKDTKETVSSDSKNRDLEADSEQLEASRIVIPTAHENSSIRSSIGDTAIKKANDPGHGTRSRKHLKIVATKIETAKKNGVSRHNPQNPAKQTSKKEKSKADVEAQAKTSETSPQKTKVEETTIDEEEKTEEKKEDSLEKSKRKRKTKEEKEAESMPLAARSTGLRMVVGAHVSSAKGRSLISAISCSL